MRPKKTTLYYLNLFCLFQRLLPTRKDQYYFKQSQNTLRHLAEKSKFTLKKASMKMSIEKKNYLQIEM